jgi:hypothetical protein
MNFDEISFERTGFEVMRGHLVDKPDRFARWH